MLYNDEDCVWVCVVCMYVSMCEREKERESVCVVASLSADFSGHSCCT